MRPHASLVITAKHMMLTASLGMAATTTCLAAERHAVIHVGASVRPHVELRVAEYPRTLSISAADVRAGFVEVRAASMLDIRSNSREGYVVEIRPMHPGFSEVDISYGDGIAHMAGEPIRLVRRDVTQAAGTLRLSYRFRLPPDTHPGTYTWPLEVAAVPL